MSLGHSHAHGRQPEIRSLLWTLLLSLAIMAIELTGGLLSGSLALRADAGHVLADASAILLSLGAVWIGTRPPDVRRTYGYYRLEILAAALNGLALIGIAAFIAWEAWHRFQLHLAVDARTMLITGAAGLVANLAGVALLWRGGSHSLNVRSALWHLAGDVLSSVGVLIAAAVMSFTGFYLLDPLLSVAIALVIVFGAVRLLAEAIDILLEAVPPHLDLAEILAHIAGADGVQAVHDLHLWTISSGMYALSSHLVVRGHDAGQNDAILTAVKIDLQREFGIAHTTLQIESDAYRHVEEVH